MVHARPHIIGDSHPASITKYNMHLQYYCGDTVPLITWTVAIKIDHAAAICPNQGQSQPSPVTCKYCTNTFAILHSYN